MDLLDRLLRHDSWTTQQLLSIAGTLTEEQLDHSFDIGHKTLRKTFSHIIWNMECWTDLMKGGSVRTRPDHASSISELSQRLESISGELYTFSREVTDQGRLDDTFLDHLDDPPQHKTFGGTILHVATHGMHHRAQVLFMLRRLGVSNLPEGDALSCERDAGRG